MTLNGVMAVILISSTEFGSFGANYAGVIEGRLYCLRQKCSPRNWVFGNRWFMV